MNKLTYVDPDVDDKNQKVLRMTVAQLVMICNELDETLGALVEKHTETLSDTVRGLSLLNAFLWPDGNTCYFAKWNKTLEEYLEGSSLNSGLVG